MKRRLDSLDLLRLTAVVLVVAQHAAMHLPEAVLLGAARSLSFAHARSGGTVASTPIRCIHLVP